MAMTQQSYWGAPYDPWSTWSDYYTMPAYGGTNRPAGRPRTWRRRQRAIPIDVIEFPEYYEIKADIPGQPKEKVQLSVDGDTLRIGVDRTEEEMEMPGANYFRAERTTGYHTRYRVLPTDADADKITAEYKHGVLIVKIPKRGGAARAEPKQIGVQ